MMRSQAVALPHADAQTALATIAAVFTAIEQATSAPEAANLADQSRILAAAIRAANLGLEAQNQAAHLHLVAERKLGELLEVVIRNGVQSTPEGIERHRSQRARKLAQIPPCDWDTFIANTLSAGKELTQAAALRLAPAAERPERKSIADTYTAPPIDVQLARELGLGAADARAQALVDAVQAALNDMPNRRHAFVWAKYHGIQDDGTIGDRWVFPGIALMIGASREYTEGLYYRASTFIFQRTTVAMLNEWGRHMAATTTP